MRQELTRSALAALLSLPLALAASSVSTEFATVTAFSTTTTTIPVATGLSPENGGSGSDPSSSGVDVAAGAAGPDTGSQGLSKGGLIGLSVGIAVVVIIIVPLTFLFVIAKKRGWEARASLRRASRRLTGKMESARVRRQSRSQGVRMQSPRRQKDVEKGKANPSVQAVKQSETPKISKFDIESPVAKSWKDKFARK